MVAETSPLLIVEDNDEDFEIFELAFRAAGAKNPLRRCADGQSALDFLFQRGSYGRPADAPRPCLVLLDLNLAGVDGREVLARIKRAEGLRSIPVVVFSTSANPRDVEACYGSGANGYMLKPVDLPRLERRIRLFKEMWLDNMVLPEDARTKELP